MLFRLNGLFAAGCFATDQLFYRCHAIEHQPWLIGITHTVQKGDETEVVERQYYACQSVKKQLEDTLEVPAGPQRVNGTLKVKHFAVDSMHVAYRIAGVIQRIKRLPCSNSS